MYLNLKLPYKYACFPEQGPRARTVSSYRESFHSCLHPSPTAKIQKEYVPSERLYEHDSPAPTVPEEQGLPLLRTHTGLHGLSVLAALTPPQPRVQPLGWGAEGQPLLFSPCLLLLITDTYTIASIN